MKTLVIYDSVHGNTEQIARAIGKGIGGEVKIVRPSELNGLEFKDFGLLVIGSPTQGGRPLPSIKDFVDKIPPDTLKNLKIAVFDTRIPAKWVSIFKYAAGRISAALEEKGIKPIAPPEGFFVKGTKGPLKEGELERAVEWAKNLA